MKQSRCDSTYACYFILREKVDKMAYKAIGKSFDRKDAINKVTGTIHYTADIPDDYYYVELVTSQYAHAMIQGIDTKDAEEVTGVMAVITGKDYPVYTGPIIVDRPVLAIDRVLYFGEPVVAVIADTPSHAKEGATKVKIQYEPLPVVNSIEDALNPKAPILHPQSANYETGGIETRTKDVFPIPDTNVANLQRIRKGQPDKVFRTCDTVVENTVSFEQSNYAATETRCCTCTIKRDGQVNIDSSTQGPFVVQGYIAKFFNIPIQKVNVTAPPVGGGFGGKTPVIFECIAYIASKAVGGHPVKLLLSRYADMVAGATHIGLKATVKLGATKDGIIKAYHSTFYFDGGAYADKAITIIRAAAQNCTGPYNIEHVYCDSYCMYTNHTFATAYRGFGHTEMTFAVERAVELLAQKLRMDPLELRYKNAITANDYTPTGQILTGKIGSLKKCITKLEEQMDWDGRCVKPIDDHTLLIKGVCAFWKSYSIPVDAVTGVIITFNEDGSANLNCGLVEIGQGAKSTLAQIITEVLTIPYDKINVIMPSNTSYTPHDWKTAASRGIFMCGNATYMAAMNVKRELFERAATVLRTDVENIFLEDGVLYQKTNLSRNLPIKELIYGYSYPNGNKVMGQIIGTGTYVAGNRTPLSKETGQGAPSSEWTVGAQGVVVSLDLHTYDYKVIDVFTAIDAGTIINPALAEGQVKGGMSMGISFGSREEFVRNKQGKTLNPSLRTYQVLRYGDIESYNVAFIETPQVDGPYGARGIGEHGTIGMPAALANALSLGLGVQLNHLPLFPETLWRAKEGGR